MKFLSSIFFILFLVAVLATGAEAQSRKGSSGGIGGYSTGIGLRGGWWPGLTVKHFIKSDAAIEGMLHTWSYHGGVRLTVLYEKHAQAFNSNNFLWYYGAGAHIGARNRYHWRNKYYNYGTDIGIDGILGLELLIREIPFTIGVDVKPFINFTGGSGFWDAAFNIRYVF